MYGAFGVVIGYAKLSYSIAFVLAAIATTIYILTRPEDETASNFSSIEAFFDAFLVIGTVMFVSLTALWVIINLIGRIFP